MRKVVGKVDTVGLGKSIEAAMEARGKRTAIWPQAKQLMVKQTPTWIQPAPPSGDGFVVGGVGILGCEMVDVHWSLVS